MHAYSFVENSHAVAGNASASHAMFLCSCGAAVVSVIRAFDTVNNL